jgi:hypothetical protein
MVSTATKKYVDDSVEADLFSADLEDAESPRTSNLQAGWDAANKTVLSSKTYTNDFKFTPEPKLIKFLDNAPFASYAQHWIEREGKRSFPCRLELDGSCPLCDIGDVPTGRAIFTVVDLSEEPTVYMLPATSKLFNQLRDLNSDKITGPLDKHYWRVSVSKVKKSTSYNFQLVKQRDLQEDYDMDIAEIEAVVATFEPLTDKVIYFPPRAELQEVADEVTSR